MPSFFKKIRCWIFQIPYMGHVTTKCRLDSSLQAICNSTGPNCFQFFEAGINFSPGFPVSKSLSFIQQDSCLWQYLQSMHIYMLIPSRFQRSIQQWTCTYKEGTLQDVPFSTGVPSNATALSFYFILFWGGGRGGRNGTDVCSATDTPAPKHSARHF